MKVNKARFMKEQEEKNKKMNGQKGGRNREEDGSIHGVFNTEIQEKIHNCVWLLSRKKREIEEMEYICTKLKIQWEKICSKGKHAFMQFLINEEEKQGSK